MLDRVSLEIEPGELIVLIGPSGAGKSTLLGSFNRLVEYDSGSIRLDDVEIRERAPESLRRSIGYCFQNLGLFPHWNVRENIAISGRLAGWDEARIRARVDAMLDVVGLNPAEFGSRAIDQLSGGQAQRVAVARALVTSPPLLLLDEPFGALDPETRARLQTLLVELNARERMTTILVSHDLAEALLLATRIAVLIRGQLVQVAAPNELVEAPVSREVEALLAPALERAASLASLRAGRSR